MDWDCDHLVYSYSTVNNGDQDDNNPCPMCSSDRFFIHEQPTLFATMTKVPGPPPALQEALTGRMIPYVQVLQSSDHAGPSWDSALYYVKDGALGSLRGTINMRDMPPNGTWLSPMAECRASVVRLRLAARVCVQLPDLQRMVLEQKNDDGLLYLTNKWLKNKDNMSQAIELFGPFACDAMLAPVLHKILRSSWIKKHKEQRNHELKLGWAQEFYNWNEIPRDKYNSMVFAHVQKCPRECNMQAYELFKYMVDKMTQCGFTPWSAVHVVRCAEVSIQAIDCQDCKNYLLTSCAFLLECAATEASHEHDWHVRNEAVIQLCYILYQIHKSHSTDETETSLEAWAKAIAIHSMCLQEYCGDEQNPETLVVLYANDHLGTKSKVITSGVQPRYECRNVQVYQDEAPSDLLDVVRRNDRFKVIVNPSSESLVGTAAEQWDGSTVCCISTAVDVLDKVPYGMIEAKGQRAEVISQALLSCFPRVSGMALDKLTFSVPKTYRFTSEKIWPLFVNPTRSCYALFRAVALPVSPEPAYVLELFARAWRHVPHQTLERFIPMATGGLVRVDRDHYCKHLVGPVNTLVQYGVINKAEKTLMIRVLREGVLPCFAAESESAPDQLISFTLALTFASSGLRVYGADVSARTGDRQGTVVTIAGLLYFAAWYILVYTSAVHTHPLLNKILKRTGTDADKHLCAALTSPAMTVSGMSAVHCGMCGENTVAELSKALGIVFGTILHPNIILRCAQLLVPELLMQLPFIGKLANQGLPGNVKCAIESRDVWFSQTYLSDSKVCEPPFRYLGNLAYGLYCSIQGTLNNSHYTPLAQALNEPGEFNPWYDSLVIATSQDDDLKELSDKLEQSLRISLDNKMEEGLQLYAQYKHSGSVLQANTQMCQPSDSDNEDVFLESHSVLPDTQLSRTQGQNVTLICPGLHIDTELGLCTRGNFLESCGGNALDEEFPKCTEQDPSIKTPCLTKLSETKYSKTSVEPSIGTKRLYITGERFIEALWVLLASLGKGSEPKTPEALAVLVHLAVKRVQVTNHWYSKLSICNNIKMIFDQCQEDKEFIPIAAVVGGLFQLNIAVHVHCNTYHIFNEHYKNKWAPGSVWYKDDLWHVIHEAQIAPVNIPRETSTQNCHHQGMIQAYMRLNNLRVHQVPADDYCGFHTVAKLLNMKHGIENKSAVRENLVRETAQYLIRNKQRDRFKTYLTDKKIDTTQGIVDFLLQDKRWLYADEVSFILEAHGVVPEIISEYSYPLYNPDHVFYLIKGNHFEPVIPL